MITKNNTKWNQIERSKKMNIFSLKITKRKWKNDQKNGKKKK